MNYYQLNQTAAEVISPLIPPQGIPKSSFFPATVFTSSHKFFV